MRTCRHTYTHTHTHTHTRSSMRRKTSTCTPKDVFISLTDIADLHRIRRQFFEGATDLGALICAEPGRSRQSRAFALHSTRRQPRLAPRAPASDSAMGALRPHSRARVACLVVLVFAHLLTCFARKLSGPCICTYVWPGPNCWLSGLGFLCQCYPGCHMEGEPSSLANIVINVIISIWKVSKECGRGLADSTLCMAVTYI